ncbi:MAG: hypothetical protein V3V00_16090 [Saprospiraceae bacterium]
MLLALKILLGLLGAVLLLLAGRWIFDTTKISREHDIQASSATGQNFLKGDIGGLLLTGAIMVALFLFHSQDWLYPTVLLLVCVIATRIFSLLRDGYSKKSLQAITVELVLIGVLFGIQFLS